MRHHKSTTLAALYQIDSAHLPVCSTLISSSLRSFILWTNRHVLHLPVSYTHLPVESVRTKKDSSLVVGLKLVKEQKADAFVSCGSTGAVLVGGQLIAGKIKGVKRAPLAPVIPTVNGAMLLIPITCSA